MTIDIQTALMMAVALVAGLARGFSGFGAALIFMPLASAITDPKTAATALALADIVLAAPLLPGALGRVSFPPILTMLAGATLTVPVGTWLLKSGDPITLRWMIAGLAAAMWALLVSGWRYSGAPRTPVTFTVGGLAGLFGGIAQIAGPPVVAYWLGSGAEASRTRANIIVFFAGSSVLNLANYAYAGLIHASSLSWALLVAPAYGIGMLAGTRLFGLASEESFRRISFGLIALAVITSLPVWG